MRSAGRGQANGNLGGRSGILPGTVRTKGLTIARRTAAAADQNDVVERRDAGRVAAPVDSSRALQTLLPIAPPALGAVLALGGLPSLRVALIGAVAAATGSLAIVSLNDVLQRRAAAGLRIVAPGEVRRGARGAGRHHRLARGRRLSLLWALSLVALSAALAATLAPLSLLFFGAALALAVVYGALRSVTAWRTVAAGALVGFGGLAGWAAVAPLSPRALTVFGFLALWEIGGRDIAGGLVDVEADRRRGATTVATVYGPLAAARAACVVGFAALAATVTLPMTGGSLNDLALVAGVFVVAWPGAKLWYEPTSAEAAAYRDRVSLFPAAVLLVALLPALVRAL